MYKTALWLLWRDVFLFLKDWPNNCLNSIAWPTAIIGVNAHILPAMGMPPTYGAFITVGQLISLASFTAWRAGHPIAFDLGETHFIDYELTLPIPYQVIYIKNAFCIGLRSALFSINALIIGFLLSYSVIDFSAISWGKFLFIYLIETFFFGAFAVWCATFASSGTKFTNLELRGAGPLIFASCNMFPWKTLYTISPLLGSLMLLSPWTYAYEGTRVALLNQAGSLPYWVCVSALTGFATLFILHGLWLFKKRVDCV